VSYDITIKYQYKLYKMTEDKIFTNEEVIKLFHRIKALELQLRKTKRLQSEHQDVMDAYKERLAILNDLIEEAKK